MIGRPKHNRRLVLGGSDLIMIKSRLPNVIWEASANTQDELEGLIVGSGYLHDAPFWWVNLAMLYGLVESAVPQYSRISKKYGDLPLGIEVDTHRMLDAPLEELIYVEKTAALKALIHAGKKYDRPVKALEDELARINAEWVVDEDDAAAKGESPGRPPPDNRRFAINGYAAIYSRVPHPDLPGYYLLSTAWLPVRDELEKMMLDANWFEGVSFRWVSLMIRFGEREEPEPRYHPVSRLNRGLFLSVAIDAHWLVNQPVETLTHIFKVAALKALIHAGEKYNRPVEAMRAELARIIGVDGG
jgi:hypothetical protein